MEDSEPAEDGLLAGLRWNRSARDQVQLKHKIRDLPGLLKHGLHLRKKSVSISKRARTRRTSVLPGFQVRNGVFDRPLFRPDSALRGGSSHDFGVLFGPRALLSQCVYVYVCARAHARVLHP